MLQFPLFFAKTPSATEIMYNVINLFGFEMIHTEFTCDVKTEKFIRPAKLVGQTLRSIHFLKAKLNQI